MCLLACKTNRGQREKKNKTTFAWFKTHCVTTVAIVSSTVHIQFQLNCIQKGISKKVNAQLL